MTYPYADQPRRLSKAVGAPQTCRTPDASGQRTRRLAWRSTSPIDARAQRPSRGVWCACLMMCAHSPSATCVRARFSVPGRLAEHPAAPRSCSRFGTSMLEALLVSGFSRLRWCGGSRSGATHPSQPTAPAASARVLRAPTRRALRVDDDTKSGAPARLVAARRIIGAARLAVSVLVLPTRASGSSATRRSGCASAARRPR